MTKFNLTDTSCIHVVDFQHQGKLLFLRSFADFSSKLFGNKGNHSREELFMCDKHTQIFTKSLP